MTLDDFRQCLPFVQLYFVLKYGTYLAQRWEESPVDLYHMPGEDSGFFLEVGTEYEKSLVVLRSFVSSM